MRYFAKGDTNLEKMAIPCLGLHTNYFQLCFGSCRFNYSRNRSDNPLHSPYPCAFWRHVSDHLQTLPQKDSRVDACAEKYPANFPFFLSVKRVRNHGRRVFGDKSRGGLNFTFADLRLFPKTLGFTVPSSYFSAFAR
jgi:hypothetical protein